MHYSYGDSSLSPIASTYTFFTGDTKPPKYKDGEKIRLTTDGVAKTIGGWLYLQTPEGACIYVDISKSTVERVEDLKRGDVHKAADGNVYRYHGDGKNHSWSGFGSSAPVNDTRVKRPLTRLHRG